MIQNMAAAGPMKKETRPTWSWHQICQPHLWGWRIWCQLHVGRKPESQAFSEQLRYWFWNILISALAMMGCHPYGVFQCHLRYCGDVTWVVRGLISQATRRFVQGLNQINRKDTVKALHYKPLCWKSTGDYWSFVGSEHRWIHRRLVDSHTKAQWCGKCFHGKTSSWRRWGPFYWVPLLSYFPMKSCVRNVCTMTLY